MNTKDRIAALKGRKNFLEVKNTDVDEHAQDYVQQDAVHGLTGRASNAAKVETKDARLPLRCTHEELNWWKSKAEGDGQTLSQLVRRLLDDY